MKRRLVTICVCLLLGAIVNVAVAWGCLLLPAPLSYSLYEGDDWIEIEGTSNDLELLRNAFPALAFDDDECRATGCRRLGWMQNEVRLVRDDWSGEFVESFDYRLLRREVSYVASGWPSHAMEGYYLCAGKDESLHAAIYVPKFVKRTEAWLIPLCPVWPGFAINTVFYAAVLWLLLIGPGKIRRYIRIKRGLCPACAYPIGTSDLCTECGKPVKRQWAMGNRQ